MIPKGFLFSTAEASIKRPGSIDIALILSEVEANISGTFTTNSVKAAPVKLCKQKIKSGKGQAIIVNSGNANACTGRKGLMDAVKIVSIVAKQLGIKPSLIYNCSTGVIGKPMPMKIIIPSLYILTREIGNSSFEDVAKAITTTDSFHKMAYKKIRIGGKPGIISGICKGAGMISPNMATMLCFIITDIAVEHKTLNSVLKASVQKSFNRITVDGDMSTNDTVLLMSNGMLGNKAITSKSDYFKPFQKAVDEITCKLSKLVVSDGEGATKLVEISVRGARSESDAEKASFAVANSNLVKTALYGNDANWGRIMAALGYSGIRFNEEKTDIFLNNVKVVKSGISNNKDREATNVLKSDIIKITIDLHSGSSSVKVLTCDLTEEYVHINARYRT